MDKEAAKLAYDNAIGDEAKLEAKQAFEAVKVLEYAAKDEEDRCEKEAHMAYEMLKYAIEAAKKATEMS